MAGCRALGAGSLTGGWAGNLAADWLACGLLAGSLEAFWLACWWAACLVAGRQAGSSWLAGPCHWTILGRAQTNYSLQQQAVGKILPKSFPLFTQGRPRNLLSVVCEASSLSTDKRRKAMEGAVLKGYVLTRIHTRSYKLSNTTFRFPSLCILFQSGP